MGRLQYTAVPSLSWSRGCHPLAPSEVLRARHCSEDTRWSPLNPAPRMPQPPPLTPQLSRSDTLSHCHLKCASFLAEMRFPYEEMADSEFLPFQCAYLQRVKVGNKAVPPTVFKQIPGTQSTPWRSITRGRMEDHESSWSPGCWSHSGVPNAVPLHAAAWAALHSGASRSVGPLAGTRH